MEPLITAIITTYNRGYLLTRAIQSVLKQTYSKFELIIVDNGSSDHTQNIIEQFTDKRIKYIRLNSNLGGPAARNIGIKNAQGFLIAFLDDDDEWLPEKIAKQVKLFNTSALNIGIVYTGSIYIKSSNNHVNKTCNINLSGNLYKQLLKGSIIGSVSRVMVKKECFEKTGLFDEELKSCQDWDMWLRISEHYEFAAIPEILVKIFEHDIQISKNLPLLIAGRERMINKHYSKFQEVPELLIQHLKRLGKLRCFAGQWKEAWQWFHRAIKLDSLQTIKIFIWLIFEFPLIKWVKYRNYSK
ncbi:MAG: glycosyltransferase family 2 protein [Candidatus Omnitrophica bacterium]|nr:glycosyltransferase family 2 protein [Candidatus Omnitrophota bacterium]